MIAAAIGKPTVKAAAIVHANAASTLTSGCTLSSFSDMAPTPPLGKCRSRHRDEAATASPSRTHCVQKGRGEPCSDMVNGLLTTRDSRQKYATKTTHYRYCNCDMVQKDSWPLI